jgi:hypothetical protein
LELAEVSTEWTGRGLAVEEGRGVLHQNQKFGSTLRGAVFSLLAAAIISGCASTDKKETPIPAPDVSIDKATITITNVDNSTRKPNMQMASLLISFRVFFNERDIAYYDFALAEVTGADDEWFANLKMAVNTLHQYVDIPGNWSRFASNNGSVVPLYRLNFQAKLQNGKWIKVPLELHDPAVNTAGKLWIYNEDYQGLVTDSYVQALRRPTILSGQRRNGIISVSFSVKDDRIQGGSLLCFNAAGKVIAELKTPFVNEISKEISPMLNGGKGFYVDGRTNTLSVSRDDFLYFFKQDHYEDISAVNLNLDDGYEFTDSKNLVLRSAAFKTLDNIVVQP